MNETQKRILIIDDDPFMVKAIELVLTQKGYITISVPDAEKAFQKIAFEEFDFFLVDLVLPGINGFEFVKRLKRLEKYKMVPVLMITARMEAKDGGAARVAGADDILIKPFDLELMAERIDTLIKKNNN